MHCSYQQVNAFAGPSPQGRHRYENECQRQVRTVTKRVYKLARTLPRSASKPLFKMGILIVILALTLGLAWRAQVVQRCWKPADSEGRAGDDSGLIDACARASVLVLMSLLGLLVLGVMYGNVMGAGNTSH